MAKITLTDVSNLLGNPTSAANTINQNNTLIEAALENTLSRDGTVPNSLSADLDMNHNDILNVGTIEADNIAITGLDLGAIVEQVSDLRDEAVLAAEDAVEAAAAVEGAVDLVGSAVGVKLDTTTSSGVVDYAFDILVPVGPSTLLRARLGGVDLYDDEYSIVASGPTNIIRLVADPGAGQRLYVTGAAVVGSVISTGTVSASEVLNDSTVVGATVEDALNTLLASGGSSESPVAIWTGGKSRLSTDRFKDVCRIEDFDVDLTGVNDDTSEVQKWLDQSVDTGLALAGHGKIAVSSTLIIPAGTIIRGAGRKDEWEDNFTMVGSPKGTVFVTAGSGNARRWTDINGSDPANDTPLFVAAGNGVYLEDLTMYTSGGSAWSMGLLIPSVKQCGIKRVSGFGFTDGTLYLDGTWSHLNTTLKALHPEIDPSTGMNEFTADDCWLEAGGTSGFAYKIQGTTRAGNVVPTFGDWIWAPGGVGSDCRMSNTRLGATGASGGCFSYDAQLFGTGSSGTSQYGRGASFQGVAFRSTGGSRYWMKLDRCEGITLDACYAEGGPYNELAITSRTQAGAQGIKIDNDRSISGDVTVNGVVVSTASKRLWEQTRLISWESLRGGISIPNFRAFNGTGFYDVPQITSYYANGRITLAYDNGSTRSEFFQFRTDGSRPNTDNSMSWGTASNRISVYYAGSGSINTSDLREKTVLSDLVNDEKLMAVAKRLSQSYIAYQWNDSLKEKGHTARVHFGAGAQTVAEAFEAEGLDPEDYAVWCKDMLYEEVEGERVPVLDDSGDHAYRLGLRSDLLHYLMAAYHAKKVNDLEQRLAALEEKYNAV